MTSFILKIIAMITMTIDHLGNSIFKHTTFMNVIGRIAFPIFAFQLTEGYAHTKNLKKYFLRLFLFALISQIPFMLFTSLFSKDLTLNIFFTLFFGLLAIFIYDKICSCSFCFSKVEKLNFCIKQFIAIFPAILIGILAQVGNFDYGFWGIAIIFLFYLFRNDKTLMILSFIVACILKYSLTIWLYGYHYLYLFLCLGTMLPIIFICLYNKKQGKKVKYLLYFFYPVHLFILYIVFGVFLKNI